MAILKHFNLCTPVTEIITKMILQYRYVILLQNYNPNYCHTQEMLYLACTKSSQNINNSGYWYKKVFSTVWIGRKQVFIKPQPIRIFCSMACPCATLGQADSREPTVLLHSIDDKICPENGDNQTHTVTCTPYIQFQQLHLCFC